MRPAIAAAGAAVLIIAEGLMSTSGQVVSPQGGDTSVAEATTTPRRSDDVAQDAGGPGAKKGWGIRETRERQRRWQ